METSEPILAKIERETYADRDDTWCSTTKVPLLIVIVVRCWKFVPLTTSSAFGANS